MVLAGIQSGKTDISIIWFLSEMKKCGGGDYIVVSATYPLLELKLLPAFKQVFGYYFPFGEWKEAKKAFNFFDGETKAFFATAENPESIASAKAKAALLDEAGQDQFPRATWEEVQGRLSINQGRALLNTRLYNFGWLKRELYDRWKAGDNSIEVIQFESIMNPAFPKEEFERQRKILPPWKFDMMYRGVYTRPAGMIYDSFNSSTCMISRFPIPDNWPRYVGHDFGLVNCAAVFFAQDPATGYFYAYHEYLPQETRSVSQHVEEWKKIVGNAIVLKRAGGSHQEEEVRQAYSAHGWRIQEPKIRDVDVGIQRVYGMFKLNKVFIFSDMQKLLDEIQSYSRVLDDNGEPTDNISHQERYHLNDCLRAILSDFTPETVERDSRLVSSISYDRGVRGW